MPRDSPDLMRRFVGGDTTTTAGILQHAGTDDSAELLVAAARDHLSDHPDNVLAAWIAAQHIHTD